VPPRLDFDQWPPRCRDPGQRRYAILRPLGLFPDRPAAQRVQETPPHPATVGTLNRRLAQQGMLGLLPAPGTIVTPGRQGRGPDAVVRELARLPGLYSGCESRELCRIRSATTGSRLRDPPITKLWEPLPPGVPQPLPLLDYHSSAAPSPARGQGIPLAVQGGSQTSLRRFLPGSRPTITAGIGRCEPDTWASLEAPSAAPPTPSRTAWLPVMLEGYQLQHRPLDAGGCRLGSLRGTSARSGRTVERIMARNRHLSDDIPHQRPPAPIRMKL
jgi:hypothetical protein